MSSLAAFSSLQAARLNLSFLLAVGQELPSAPCCIHSTLHRKGYDMADCFLKANKEEKVSYQDELNKYLHPFTFAIRLVGSKSQSSYTARERLTQGCETGGRDHGTTLDTVHHTEWCCSPLFSFPGNPTLQDGWQDGRNKGGHTWDPELPLGIKLSWRVTSSTVDFD